METIMRGNAAEAAVIHALSRGGLHVFVPFGQAAPTDLVALVPDSNQLVRIQVKSGRIRKGCVYFNTCSTDHGNGRSDYRNRVDVLAVHVDEGNMCFVVPVEDCPTYMGVLRLEPTRNSQRRRIRLAVDHTVDKWIASLRT